MQKKKPRIVTSNNKYLILDLKHTTCLELFIYQHDKQ